MSACNPVPEHFVHKSGLPALPNCMSPAWMKLQLLRLSGTYGVSFSPEFHPVTPGGQHHTLAPLERELPGAWSPEVFVEQS